MHVCVRERERECHSTTHTLLSSSHLRRAEVLRQMCEEHPHENLSILLPEYNSGRSLIPTIPTTHDSKIQSSIAATDCRDIRV